MKMRLPRSIRAFSSLCLASACLFGACATRAQETPDSKDEAPAKGATEGKGKWVPLFQRHAEQYVVRFTDGTGQEAKRLAEPLLRWWQPVRGGDDGAVYLWVKEGRPVAAVTFFTFKWPNGDRAIVHERHSFADEPVEATWRGGVVWHTSQPGVTFRPVPEAPAPAASPSARLRQMQAIIRDVSANTIDDKNSKWPLRPLAKPLYRFESKHDGALFALAQGTDPEAFVLLEVRGDGKDAHWEYAVTRFTDLQIHVRYKDREIFTGPNTTGQPSAIYHTATVIQKASDRPEDFQ